MPYSVLLPADQHYAGFPSSVQDRMGLKKDVLMKINDTLHHPWIQPFAWLFFWSSVFVTAPLHLLGLWAVFLWDFINGRIFRRAFITPSRECAILVTG